MKDGQVKVIKTPVKGMCDILPGDMRLRQQVLAMIRRSYASYGFTEVETPAMEHIENLTSRQGGDNEKLIFKVLKRGRELEKALAEGQGDLCDSGLRYDLTVPLARLYSNAREQLPSPFKALQIGSVWRADNPQKGRFRQFTQCDIDILGDSTDLCEIELITATASMLTEIFALIGVTDFTVHVNDRRILTGAALQAGFREEDVPAVLISLDKYDKIGLDGIREELCAQGFDPAAADRYLAYYASPEEKDCAAFCGRIDEKYLPASVGENLREIISCAGNMLSKGVGIVFDPTLVRGMGYYTGPIFEVTIDGYGFSIAGGGRYDRMIGRFSGQETPACGFSIGFERIITILRDHLEGGVRLPEGSAALLVDRRAGAEKKAEAFAKAAAMRREGKTVTVQPMQKNIGAQLSRLEAEGYTEFIRIYGD